MDVRITLLIPDESIKDKYEAMKNGKKLSGYLNNIIMEYERRTMRGEEPFSSVNAPQPSTDNGEILAELSVLKQMVASISSQTVSSLREVAPSVEETEVVTIQSANVEEESSIAEKRTVLDEHPSYTFSDSNTTNNEEVDLLSDGNSLVSTQLYTNPASGEGENEENDSATETMWAKPSSSRRPSSLLKGL